MDNIDGKLTAAGFRNDRLQAGLALPVDDRRRYCRVEASPVVALNHAVAVGMRDGPEASTAIIWLTPRAPTCSVGLASWRLRAFPIDARLR